MDFREYKEGFWLGKVGQTNQTKTKTINLTCAQIIFSNVKYCVVCCTIIALHVVVDVARVLHLKKTRDAHTNTPAMPCSTNERRWYSISM